MVESTIYGLSNEEYHYGCPYNEYLSSSQIKLYSKSPKAAKYAFDHPDDSKADYFRVGSLFHDAMAFLADRQGNVAGLKEWSDNLVVFEPPINEKTGQPYGSTTKAYATAYDEFLKANEGKTIVSDDERQSVVDMVTSLLDDGSSTSRQVAKLLKWGKPEVSHFVEYEGCKFKYRPDLETKRKIVDWKTSSTDDLSERSINSIIAKFGYDVSAAFYLFMEHLRTGVWKQFFWVFVSKSAPFDCVMVDASEWTYKYDDGAILPQVGAIKMQALLDLHIKCTRNKVWPGAEIFIPKSDNGLRIMTPIPPTWEVNNAANILAQSFDE